MVILTTYSISIQTVKEIDTMTFSNKEREKQLSLLLIKMYIPVSNSSPYIRVTTQCKFPVLFVPSEANYLSDSVLRISLFLVNPHISRDQ